MSLETWKKEFYPIDAKKVSSDEALQHSLKKWVGLREENLARHGVELDGNTIYDIANFVDDVLDIDSISCALCVHFLRYDDDESNATCQQCPLYEYLGGQECAEHQQPYDLFLGKGDVDSMITALEGTINQQKGESCTHDE